MAIQKGGKQLVTPCKRGMQAKMGWTRRSKRHTEYGKGCPTPGAGITQLGNDRPRTRSQSQGDTGECPLIGQQRSNEMLTIVGRPVSGVQL